MPHSGVFAFSRTPPTFSPTFVRSLAITIALHLVILAAFSFTDWKPSQTVVILEAIPTLSELPPPQEESIATQPDQYGILPVGSLPDIPCALPYLSSLEHPSYSPDHFTLPRQTEVSSMKYLQTEPVLGIPEPDALDFLSEEPQLQFYVSGPLANFQLIDNHERLSPLLQNSSLSGLYQLQVQVRVDPKTGQIFWYQSDLSDENKELSDLTDKIIDTIRFEPQPYSLPGEGAIEIQLSFFS